MKKLIDHNLDNLQRHTKQLIRRGENFSNFSELGMMHEMLYGQDIALLDDNKLTTLSENVDRAGRPAHLAIPSSNQSGSKSREIIERVDAAKISNEVARRGYKMRKQRPLTATAANLKHIDLSMLFSQFSPVSGNDQSSLSGHHGEAQ